MKKMMFLGGLLIALLFNCFVNEAGAYSAPGYYAPNIYGQWIVCLHGSPETQYFTPKPSVVLYNLTTGKMKTLDEKPVASTQPAGIFMDRVVFWGYDSLKLYQISSNTTQSFGTVDSKYPAIFNNDIVYLTYSGSSCSVNHYNLLTKTSTVISDKASGSPPKIHSGKIYWAEAKYSEGVKIYMYNISTKKTKCLVELPYGSLNSVIAATKDKIAFVENGNVYVCLIDSLGNPTKLLASNDESKITSQVGEVAIYFDNVYWVNNNGRLWHKVITTNDPPKAIGILNDVLEAGSCAGGINVFASSLVYCKWVQGKGEIWLYNPFTWQKKKLLGD